MNLLHFQSENRKENSTTLLDSRFVFLNLSFFLTFTNIAFLYLYPVALDAMGNEHHVIGLVMGLFSCAAVISRPFLGKLVTLKGEYLVISLGTATSLLATLCYNLITTFGPCMVLIRVIHGIGFSAFIAASFSLAAKTVHPGRRGEAFGIIGASLMGAIALAPPVGEVLIQKWGFHGLYMAASVSVLLAWLAAFMALRPISFPALTDEKIEVQYLPLFKNKSFLFLLISTLIFAHCQATVPNFLALIAAEKGVASGRFFLASYVIAILALLTMGKAIDRFGKLRFMIVSYPFLSLGIILIPGMIGCSLFAVPALLYGAGMGVLFSTHNALAASHGTEIEKPATMALFTAVYDTGFITGAVVSGWFAFQTNLETLFLACGSYGFIGLFVVILSPIKDS